MVEHAPCDFRAPENVQSFEIVGCFLQVLEAVITVEGCNRYTHVSAFKATRTDKISGPVRTVPRKLLTHQYKPMQVLYVRTYVLYAYQHAMLPQVEGYVCRKYRNMNICTYVCTYIANSLMMLPFEHIRYECVMSRLMTHNITQGE